MEFGSVPQGLKRRLVSARHSYLLDILLRTYHAFVRNQGTIFAAAISYYVLFSLFPLAILLVAIFGLFIRSPVEQIRATNMIAEQFPSGVTLYQQVARAVTAVAHGKSGIVGLLAFAGLAWTASSMFGALRRALNHTFRVTVSRSYIHGRAWDMLTMLAVTILLALSVGLTAGLGLARSLASDHFHGVLLNVGWAVVFFSLPLVTSFAVFLLTFRMVPNHTLTVRDLWVGALIAAVGFELAKLGFSLYVAKFGQYREIYGPLGGVVIFLFFVYLAANVVIFAAGISAELAIDRAAGTRG